MKLSHFVRILAVVTILSGYTVWSLAVRQPRAPVGEGAPTSVPLLRLEEAHALWKDPATLFLDVRSDIDYDVGHIAGAIHFPEIEFEKRFPELKDRLQRAKNIVVYCKSTDCGLSLWAAIRLRNEGLTQTRIFPTGYNDWVNRGLPVDRNTQQ
jgi:rhodanese-related sulfurtransferase